MTPSSGKEIVSLAPRTTLRVLTRRSSREAFASIRGTHCLM